MQKTRENASATIKYAMSEVMQIQFFETQNYPFSACISDTGGAAGLFLGLNAIGKLPLYVSLRHLCHKIFFWSNQALFLGTIDVIRKAYLYLKRKIKEYRRKDIVIIENTLC